MFMSADQTDHKISCRTCGADITAHARYNRWTQCSVCYWKNRLDHQKPIADLLGRRSDIRARLAALPAEIAAMRSTIEEYTAELKANAAWWQKLLGAARDHVLDGHWQRSFALQNELRELEGEQSRLQMTVETAKKTKKRFLAAQIAQNAAEVRNRLLAQEHESFCSETLANLEREFERTQFYIQPRDYKRGNAIDNYFRKTLSEAVLKAFGQSCVFCGERHNLTFDHYGLPKNEGGNFVLILADKRSVRLNIVVLCRGCNGAKGQRPHLFYFGAAQREQATACQKALLDILLCDQKFLTLVKKWSL